MEAQWVLGLGLVLTALFAVGAGFLILTLFPARGTRRRPAYLNDGAAGTVFLFDGDVLVDSTPGARALLAGTQTRGSAWLKLMSWLGTHFPGIEAELLRLPHEGALTLTSAPTKGEPLLLQAEMRGGLTRLTLIDPAQDDRSPGQDPLVQRAQFEELELLRQTILKAPILIWRERADGEVTWANSAYLLRAADMLAPGKDLTWPLPRIFDRLATAQGASGQRQHLHLPGGKSLWYDLITSGEGEGRLLFAMPADAAVQAETALRDFMQTLTKTFAHLHVGLAIFDNQRQLQLFNPAMLELTGLPVDFLSMRPSLLSVLDAMRDRNMIPEPKDYRGWRRQLIEMEQAAAKGLYEETWSLPGGQTYRVIGRPHPNGALALMIEDISSEMLRTRRYRADLELSQAVLDEMDQAIAVFAETGQLVMSNAAYARLWNHDPSETLADASLTTLCDHWRALSSPTTLWTEVETYAANPGERAGWADEARLLDGRLLDCRFSPLAGGAMMAAFRPITAAENGKPQLAEAGKRRRA